MNRKGPVPTTPKEKLFANIVKKESGCWLYKNRPNEYGKIFLSNKVGEQRNVFAHRLSYEVHIGPIPQGMYICHKCDVRGCVNPEHLYAGTHEDNTRDVVERGRHFSEKHYENVRRMRKMDDPTAELLKADYATGRYTQFDLAKKYGCSQATVSCTIRGAKNQSNGTGGKKRTGHFRRKVQPEQYQEIRDLYATGQFTQNALAERFGIDQTTVSAIINFKLRGMKP